MVKIGLLALAGLYAADYLSARYGIPGKRQTLGKCASEAVLRGAAKERPYRVLCGRYRNRDLRAVAVPASGVHALLVLEPPPDEAHRDHVPGSSPAS